MNIQQPNHLTYMFTYCHLCLIVTVFKYLFFVFVCNNKCMYLEHKQFYCQQGDCEIVIPLAIHI